MKIEFSRVGRASRRILIALVAALLVGTTVVAVPASPVHADEPFSVSLALPSGAATSYSPGQTVHYFVSWSCSVSAGGTCDGTQIVDTFPTFIDVYGAVRPLEFVSATSDGKYMVGSAVATATDVTWTMGPDALAGTSGFVELFLRIPVGIVPSGPPVSLTDSARYVVGAVPSTPVTLDVTTSATAPNWTITKTDGPDPALTEAIGETVTYTIRVCPDATTMPGVTAATVVDTLPPGATFLSASDAGVYAANTADPADDTVTWTLTNPTLDGHGCATVTTVVRYDQTANPSEPPVAADNVVGAMKTNSVTGEGSLPGGGTDSLGTATATTTLRGYTPRIGAGKNSSGEYYVLDGQQVTYGLTFSNNGEVPLTNAVYTDTLPAGFTLTSIVPGSSNDGSVTMTVEVSTDGSSFVAFGSYGGSLGAVVKVRWVATGTLRCGYGLNPACVAPAFALTGAQLVGTVSGSAGDSLQNCATVAAGAQGTTSTRCATVLIEAGQPHATITKVSSDSTRSPGSTGTFTLTATNVADATGPLVAPIVTDCVPKWFILDAAWADGTATLPTDWSFGADPSCSDAADTALRFQYTGSLAPGQSAPAIVIPYRVSTFGDPLGPTPPATYTNSATVSSIVTPISHCVVEACTAAASVTVPVVGNLASQKRVRGQLDADFRGLVNADVTEPGETVAGGSMTWRLRLQNTGNVPVEDVVYIDTFPHVGDTGQRDSLPRGTQWTPYLVSPITVPMGWTVEYSTTRDPCESLIGVTTNCTAGAVWVTNPNPNPALYSSIRLRYSGAIAIGGTAQFEWAMRAPVFDPTYELVAGGDPYDALDTTTCTLDLPSRADNDISDCPKAVNSFAYGATPAGAGAGAPRLYSEPERVQIRVTSPPIPNIVGNRVWSDVDHDGIQDSGELGIAKIRVELYRQLPDTSFELYDYTYTDANGNYLFADDGDPFTTTGIPDGNYRLRFYPTTNAAVQGIVTYSDRSGVTTDAGVANTDDDSDIAMTPTGTDATFGAYHDTAVIALGTGFGESDLTWDAGIWVPNPKIVVDKVTKDTAWPDAQAGDDKSIVQGRGITWIYTITNTGNTRLENVTLVDDKITPSDFSANVTCTVENAGANALLPTPPVTTAASPIALNPGAVVECRVTGTAKNSSYSNLATTVGTPKQDDGTAFSAGVASSVTDTDTSSYVPLRYDLALVKTVAAPDFATGNVVFTVTVRNQGNIASGVYTVTDTLPGLGAGGGLSYVSSNPPVTPSGSQLVWENQPSLAANASATFTITMRIDDWTERPWTNVAEISADSSALVQTGGITTPTTDIDSTPGDVATSTADNTLIGQAGGSGPPTDVGFDDEDIAVLSPTPTYDLALAKTVNATNLSSIGVGTVTHAITVKNQGSVASGAYQVTDTVPAGMTVSTPVPGSGVVTVGSPTTIVWTGSSLAPGASATFTYTASISDLTLRPYRNFAEISADSAQSLYSVNDVDSTPDAITGNDMPNPKTYGPVGSPTAGGADNISINEAGTGSDGEDDADIADLSLPLTNGYDLALIKTVDAAAVSYDGTVTYTITVQNQGVLDSHRFTITDVVPPGLTVDESSILDGGQLTVGPSTTTIVWTVGELTAGSSITRTFSASIADITKRPFRNVAEISADSAGSYSSAGETIRDKDSVPGDEATNAADNLLMGEAGGTGDVGHDDEDIAVFDVPVVYDLALVKTVDAPSTTYDGTIVFSVLVKNQGNVPSSSFTVVDHLPEGMAFESASDGGTYDAPGHTVTWAMSSLAPGASKAVSVTVSVSDTTERPFVNSAEITADSAASYSSATETVRDIDSVPGDEATSSIDNTLIAQAGSGEDAGFDDEDVAVVGLPITYDLALIKTADVVATKYDGTIMFSVTVANQGNVPSGSYTVVDTLPEGLAFASASDGGVFDEADGTVTWALPSVDPGETVTVTVTVSVEDTTKRPFVNRAEITADSADSYSSKDLDVVDVDSEPGDEATSQADNEELSEAGVPDDDEAFDDEGFDDEDIAVVNLPITYDLALIKTADVATTTFDGTVVFSVTVQNQGNVPSGSYTVVDTLPEGLAFASASDGGVFDEAEGTITWALPSIVPGAMKVVTVTTTVSDVMKRPFTNSAEITVDSAGSYSVPDGEQIVDVDSVPGDDDGNGIDNSIIAAAGLDGDVGFDDEDIAVVNLPITYDMALVKTADVATTTFDGTVVFSVTVANQGNVPSGSYTVVDSLPEGLAFVSASDGGVHDASAATVTWTLSSLLPGATKVVTVTTTVSDVMKRPFTNSAEIVADSSAGYSLPGGTAITDVDSVPGDGATSTADHSALAEAGTGQDIGFDDEDVARVDVPIVYDLDLAKRLLPGQSYKLGSVLRYEIEITNQGNVPSGTYSVRDVLPIGLTYVSSSDGGLGMPTERIVTWTDLPSLLPGASKVVTIDVRIDDITQPSYVNVAEITEDGADELSTPADPVHDQDSSPGSPGGVPQLGEDDTAVASLPLVELATENTPPPTGELPRTGSDLGRSIGWATVVMLVGLVAIIGTRRRRRLG